MERSGHDEHGYRVLLLGVGGNTEEERNSFCTKLSEAYGIPFSLLREITQHCPTVLKKNLTLEKAVTLARTLKSFGANSSVQERRSSTAISLDFQNLQPHRLALESCSLKKTESGSWVLIGRVRNISGENQRDVWVLTQVLDEEGEICSLQEVPMPINPLPPSETSPFRVVLDEGPSVKKVCIAFKTASGEVLPAEDRRKSKEWVEVGWETESGDELLSSLVPLEPGTGLDNRKGSGEFGETESPESGGPPNSGGTLLRKASCEEHTVATGILAEGKGSFFSEQLSAGGETGHGGSNPSEDPLPMTDAIEEMMGVTETKSPEKMVNSSEIKEESNSSLEIVGLSIKEDPSIGEAHPAFSASPAGVFEMGTDSVDSPKEEPLVLQREAGFQGSRLDLSIFEEASKLLEEISTKPAKKDGEQPLSFPWIDGFRKSVQQYLHQNPDPFCSWFQLRCHSERLANPHRSLLTILSHARFHQTNESEKALMNTQRVYEFLDRPNLRLSDIPPLEKALSFSGESWKELFYKALPKLRQVAGSILERKNWSATELERLIQIIPHMGDRNSRMAVRWINELIPDVVEIDPSTLSPFISEALYRVSARLGVVDPHFDTYNGRNSVGDLKIQALARTAFPQSPWKIEKPMNWVGTKAEEAGGGYCLPLKPQCHGCLFEGFCAKLYPDFNPSERGIKAR